MEKPVCWVVTDGRAGNRSQALALAEAMARIEPFEIAEKRIRIAERWQRLPSAFWGDPFRRLARDSDALGPPWPDLWIGCGRASVPLTIAVKQKRPSTFTIHLQNPRAPLDKFDLVVAPAHDALTGANVVSMIGSPNRIVSKSAGEPADAITRVAVLIGGPNRAFRFDAETAAAIDEKLAALEKSGIAISLTTSRRTPPAAAEALGRDLKARPFWRADRHDAANNPYPAMLDDADIVLVTEDSVNMAAEAATAGKPVYILPLPRKRFASARKFDAFHEGLRAIGAARRFDGALEHWRYTPLDETRRAAEEAVRRWRDFQSRPRVR